LRPDETDEEEATATAKYRDLSSAAAKALARSTVLRVEMTFVED
jgi:hypothetical protein